MKFVACGLFAFALIGCGTLRDGDYLPKERFLREQNNEARTYTLWETSIQVLNLGMMHESSRVLQAYHSLKTKFSNNVELVEYLDKQSERNRDIHAKNLQRITAIEGKMSPGDTIYEFTLTEEKKNRLNNKRTASGKLILDRKGNLVWRKIESANYPFWEEEASTERVK
jgi:hypothetical protein